MPRASATYKIEQCEDITSVETFISSVFKLRSRNNDRKFWYRGHSNYDYKLVPSIGRPYEYGGEARTFKTTNEEIYLLHRFRRRAYPHLERALTAGEAIFVARHHGLPTRLLDWTANALFALYFAVRREPQASEKSKPDGKIWAMAYSQTWGLDAFKLAKYENEAELFEHRVSGRKDCHSIKIVYPLFNTPRLLAQDGAFTFHSHPSKSLEEYESEGQKFIREELDIEVLFWWHIVGDKKNDIIKQLSGLGITERSVFPDLDGVARSLLETAVLWSSNDPI